MSSAKRRITSIKIDEMLWKEVRKHAIDNDTTLAEFVERAIRKELGKA